LPPGGRILIRHRGSIAPLRAVFPLR